MKAFIIERYGKKVALRATEIPEPELGKDDVLGIPETGHGPVELRDQEKS
ncbi:hypothetical protein AB7M29_004002 [Pseudomonas sp. F-14 TE3623]